MISHFVKIMDDLKKNIQRKNTENQIRRFYFFGQFLKYDTKIWGVKRSKKCRNFGIPES